MTQEDGPGPDQVALADRFRESHRAAKVLILPNVWDVVSAKLYEQDGFLALGTTSAGIAATLGFADGQVIGVEETARVVRAVVRRVGIPVSADIEAGYAEDEEGVARSARIVMEAGAVGLNLEDSLSGRGSRGSVSLFGADAQCARIRAVRGEAKKWGLHLFINARTDADLVDSLGEPRRLAEAVRRGNLYLEAGADGVFVPDQGDLSVTDIKALASEIAGPLNLIAGEVTPPVPELHDLGVARLSFGPRAMRAALSCLLTMAREWREEGTYRQTMSSVLTYGQVNRWFQDLHRGGPVGLPP